MGGHDPESRLKSLKVSARHLNAANQLYKEGNQKGERMIVFVTGATGTLGRPAVRLLVASGHQVRALSRSEANDRVIRELGGEPIEADLFDPKSLNVGMTGTDAVLHLATKIPEMRRIGRRASWRETDRIRREGTRNLVDVALAHGAKAFVYPSIVFLYPDRGGAWVDAGTLPEPAEYLATTLVAEAEVARFVAAGGRGVTLRMGAFYDATSSQSQEMIRAARMGVSPTFGRDDAYQPLIWVDDAAQAVVVALKAPSGVYDVADDEPLTRGELRAVIARAAGRPTLWRIPNVVTYAILGVTASTLMRSQRVSNARFKAATGWTPEVPSAREGWTRIASGPLAHQNGLGAPSH